MDKPIELVIEETKYALCNIINQANLPHFVLKPLVKEIYMQIETQSNIATQKAIETYNNSIDTEDKEE